MRSVALYLSICLVLLTATSLAVADRQNDAIGFSPNHVFDNALAGESVDVLSGNMNLEIPLGPRYSLSDTFSYQVKLYYNSKLWEHDCRGVADPEPCPGEIITPNYYGIGFTIRFGRIYRDPNDKPDVYKYQSPDGAEHYFLCAGTSCTTDTTDGSGIHIERSGTNTWKVYPGDKTKITLTHYFGGNSTDKYRAYGGWFATRIQGMPTNVAGEPLFYFDIDYGSNSSKITSLEDSAGRRIEFTNVGSYDVDISFPSFAGTSSASSSRTTYRLRRTSQPIYDPSDSVDLWQDRKVLSEIQYPTPSERYQFAYGASGSRVFGYLLSRTIPTGATFNYHYTHFADTSRRPYHTELVYKDVVADSVTSRWTYTRFGDGVVRSLNDFYNYHDGEQARASNPSKVRVLDPFDNLTVHWFNYTLYSGSACNAQGECPTNWTDGMPIQIVSYAGPSEDAARQVQTTQYGYKYDGTWLQYRNQVGPSRANAYSIAEHARPERVTTTYHGGNLYPSRVHEQRYGDWDGNPRVARQVEEFDGDSLYRVTFTNFGDSIWGSDFHDYSEVRDATGAVLERTDREFRNGRIECEVARKTGAGIILPGCSSSDLALASGDVAAVRTFSATTGSLTSEVISGGDDSGSRTVTYEFVNGTLREKQYDGFAWSALDRSIDFNTGLTYESLDPAGTRTTYAWDALGRLTQIAPRLPERPTAITYPSLLETRVREDVTASNFVEGVYLYDQLGRLKEARKRNLDGAYDVQLTQYDITGRVTKKSEWMAQGTVAADIKWTTYDYTRARGPELDGSGNLRPYPDPLGRVTKVTSPDGAIVDTAYEGGTTTVTSHGIKATNGLIDGTTSYTNDTFGRLTRVDSAGSGADADYSYDRLDRLTQVDLTNPTNAAEVQTRRFEYDRIGRLRSASNPENGTAQYLKYDARGNLLESKDARLHHFVNTFDGADRLRTRAVRQGSDLLLARNTYDSIAGSAGAHAGRLVQQESFRVQSGVSSLVATEQYVHGAAGGSAECTLGIRGYAGLNGRLTQTIMRIAPWATDVKTDYCQDDQGLPYLTAYPDISDSGRTRSRVGRQYHNGFLWEVHDLGRDIEYVDSVSYASGGVLTGIHRPNSVRQLIDLDSRKRPSQIRVLTTQAAIPRPPLTTLAGCGGGGSGPAHLQYCGQSGGGSSTQTLWDTDAYAYDGAGNIKSIGTDQYSYDALNRLTRAIVSPNGSSYTLNYSYDSFGNMITSNKAGGTTDNRTFGVDWRTNRLTSEARTGYPLSSFVFDENGSMRSAGSTSYDVGIDNRLDKIASETKGTIATYFYDASGYRVRSESAGVETFYFRDGSGQVLSEFQRTQGVETAPAWNKDYIYGLGKNLTLVKNDVPTTPRRPKASNVSGTSITVTWDTVPDPDVTSYRVKRFHRQTNNSAETGTPPVNVGNVVSYTDSTFPPMEAQTRVRYMVYAVDSAGNESEPSQELIVRPLGSRPLPPGGVGAVPSDRGVRLYWNAVSAEDLYGYQVKRSTNGSTYTLLNTQGAIQGLEFYDANLTNGTNYLYYILV